MNAKKYFVATIVLSGVLLAFAASFWPAKRSGIEPSRLAMSGPAGKFGPLVHAVLPSAESEGTPEILDLETGEALSQPPIDSDSRATEIVAWIRSSGLDIS